MLNRILILTATVLFSGHIAADMGGVQTKRYTDATPDYELTNAICSSQHPLAVFTNQMDQQAQQKVLAAARRYVKSTGSISTSEALSVLCQVESAQPQSRETPAAG